MNAIDEYFGKTFDNVSGNIGIYEIFEIDGDKFVRVDVRHPHNCGKFKLAVVNLMTTVKHEFEIESNTGVTPKHMLEYFKGETFVPLTCDGIKDTVKMKCNKYMPFGTRLLNGGIEFIVSRVYVKGENYFVLMNSKSGFTYSASVKSRSGMGATRDEFELLIGKDAFEFFTGIVE